jgi:hypothetical protein
VHEKNAITYCAGVWTLAGLVLFAALLMGAVYGPHALLTLALPAVGAILGACLVTYSFRR